MATIKSRIILRNDTSANWDANSSVVLLKGEVGIEFLESGGTKIKVGDGVTPWSNLKSIADGQITDSDLRDIINDYLEENPITVETDTTLSVAGQPADAAAIRETCIMKTDCLILSAGDADDNIFA